MPEDIYRRITAFLFCLCLFDFFAVSAQNDPGKITITVGDFLSIRGNLLIKVLDSASFKRSSTAKPIRIKTIPVISKRMTVQIDSIPAGRYVISATHDENGNERFEYIREDYAYSRAAPVYLGPPKFDEAVLDYDGKSKHIYLRLENEFAGNITSYKNRKVISPVIGYTPETSALAGANIVQLFRYARADSATRTSFADVLAIATFKKQIVIEQNYTIFSNREKYMFIGYTSYQRFPQYYFGIGNDVPSSNKELVKYDQIWFDHLALRNIYGKLFAGIGYRYINIFNVSGSDTGVLLGQPVLGNTGSVSSGLQLAVASDTRTNIYNSLRGHMIRVRGVFNRKVLGSRYDFNILETDIRGYLRIKNRHRDVLAAQAYGYFSGGDVPWNQMGTLGNDVIMRGYYSGRFRDKDYVAAQIEYRHSFNKVYGAALFAGAGEVAHTPSALSVKELKPSIGAGVRLTLDRKERLNLRVDMGFGQNTSNLYVSVAEAF
jgi:uncharacterized protein (DUF2141 family)